MQYFANFMDGTMQQIWWFVILILVIGVFIALIFAINVIKSKATVPEHVLKFDEFYVEQTSNPIDNN